MPALGERFLIIPVAALAILRQLGVACSKLVQGAASLCNCASQVVYELPWDMKAHALAKLFLSAFVRNFFSMDVVADMDDCVHKPPMQTLTMGGKLAFMMSNSSSRCQITPLLSLDMSNPPFGESLRKSYRPRREYALAGAMPHEKRGGQVDRRVS
jgi:hypothetical protein